jgi:DNA-binding transcriptional MocR family regulator
MTFIVEPQAEMRPGIIELRWGDPDPALIPVAAIGDAARWVADTVGAAALNYGPGEGPIALRETLAARISRSEGHPIDLAEIAVTNGNSPSIQLLLSHLVGPGDAVFTEDPGFSLAIRMARDLSLHLVAVPLDADGMDVDVLAERVARTRAEGRRPRLVYTVATYGNPSGTCLSEERRRRLVELAVEEDLVIVEDDVYRELAYDGPAPQSLWRIAAEVDGASERVIRLGTFSKTLAPGLRCGWITSGAARLREFTERGVFDSGGCPSQYTACICAHLVREGVYDENVTRVRAAYKERRDALIDGLRTALPDGCAVASPSGGLFAWVTLPDDLVAGDLLAAGEAHGIAFFDGARFSISGHDRGLRLGFSMYGPDDLREGAARLGRTLAEARADR